jgi:hypothetical protein
MPRIQAFASLWLAERHCCFRSRLRIYGAKKSIVCCHDHHGFVIPRCFVRRSEWRFTSTSVLGGNPLSRMESPRRTPARTTGVGLNLITERSISSSISQQNPSSARILPRLVRWGAGDRRLIWCPRCQTRTTEPQRSPQQLLTT